MSYIKKIKKLCDELIGACKFMAESGECDKCISKPKGEHCIHPNSYKHEDGNEYCGFCGVKIN